MRTVTTNRNITTVLHIVYRVAVLCENPDLHHVASLAIGACDGDNSHNGLLVDG